MTKNYKRPTKTYQDTLDEKKIKELLKDYEPVEDIYSVPLNSHLRYFTVKDNKKQFRMGGYLDTINEEKGYVKLTNGKTTWSVQVNEDTDFFRKPEISEIKEYYEKKLDKYRRKISKLETTIEQIKNRLHKR